MFSKSHQLPASLEEFIRQDIDQLNPKSAGLYSLQLSTRTVLRLNHHLLRQFSDRFEYALLFNWVAGVDHVMHIDGSSSGKLRLTSLNLVISGGTGSTFQWYKAITTERGVCPYGFPSIRVQEETAELLHEEPLQKCALVRTDIPHKVGNIKERTTLVCIRTEGNLDLLSNKEAE